VNGWIGDPLIRKVLFAILIPLILVWVIIAIPYIQPRAEPISEPYPWLKLGIETIKNYLWDSQLQMFRESVKENQSFWIDDQTKLLTVLLKDPETYESNISQIIETLHEYYNNGYLPRRYVKVEPDITNNTLSNFEMVNGFLKVHGNLLNPSEEKNSLRLTYYEAAGEVTFTYLYGQRFIVDPETGTWDWITYDPVNERAEQMQNPGFDHNSSETESSWWQGNFIPWEFSFPKHWFWGKQPPFHCVYPVDIGSSNRIIGFEIPENITERDWRSEQFDIAGNVSYTVSFRYKGTISYGEVRFYFRYYNSTGHWIGEDVLTLTGADNMDVWTTKSLSVTTPEDAVSGDIRIVAPANQFNGKAFFDAISGVDVLNPDFTVPDGYPFTNGTFHSRWRSLRILGSGDYGRQRLVKTVPVSNVYNLTWHIKAVSPPQSYRVHVFYDDLTYSTFDKTCNNDTWVKNAIQGSSLTAGKTVYAVAFQGQTGEITIDDVAFNYKPSGASYGAIYELTVDSATGEAVYSDAIQYYSDNDVALNITWRFEKGKPYLQQVLTAVNKHADAYSVDFHLIASVNQLSTITSGEEDRKTSYRSVWIPGIGRRYADPNSWITPLLDCLQEEYWKWQYNYNYYIFELMQIPEWSGCLGLAYQFPEGNVPYYMQTTQNPDKTLWDDETGKFLHYVTTSFRKPVIKPANTTSITVNMFCLNGYDFVEPSIYNSYFLNIQNYDNVDLSLNFHLGQIAYALACYREVKGLDPYGMAEGVIRFYHRIFNGHNNGTYIMTSGKMIEACVKMHKLTGDSFYSSFADSLAENLVANQLSDGRFPMKHNNVTYLDCQAVALMGLRLTGYTSAYSKGLKAVHYDYLPGGYHRIPVGYVGDNIPHEKRLFVYANATHVDDDFWTYKASYVSLASLGKNDTLTMLGLSRVWSRTTWNATHLFIWNSESLPGKELTIDGNVLVPEVNSETHPWGLLAWLKTAQHQRGNYNYYYMFLECHRAIVEASFSETSVHTKIYGWNDKGTISRFSLKGKEEYVVVKDVKIDGESVSEVETLPILEASGFNCYYIDEDASTLYVKAFPRTNELVTLDLNVESKLPEPWMPIMPIIGTLGFLMIVISPVYLIQKVRKGEFAEGLGIAFVLFIIGFAFIVGWLWSV
jgi:hypothetical protein